MILNVLVVILLLGSAGAAEAQRRPGIIPSDWTQEPAKPDDGWQKYVSPDGTAWLALATSPARTHSRQQRMDPVAPDPTERITYERRTSRFIAVSGFRGERIFYRKSNLACGGTQWHHIALEYPAADKRKLDATVTHIAHAMNHYDNQCRRGG
jgi:serine/threonine-protein kinase